MVIALILIFLFIPYIQVESNDSIEIKGGYGDEVIEPGKILFAHYIGVQADDVFVLGYTEYISVKLNWTYPPNVILGIIIGIQGNATWIGMITEKNSTLTLKTGNYTVIKILNYNSYDVDVDGYILYNSTKS